MKDKKGFTLIELLAIIVILAIIAVITVPVILNIIDNSKVGAAKDSAYGYKDAINTYYAAETVKNPNVQMPTGYIDVEDLPSNFSASGKLPTNDSWVQLEKGQVVGYSLKFDDYVVTKYKDEEPTCEKGDIQPKNKRIQVTVGEEVCYGPTGSQECFKVIKKFTENNETKAMLLPNYNLKKYTDNTTNPATITYKQESSDPDKILFSDSNYWMDTTTTPATLKSVYSNNGAYTYETNHEMFFDEHEARVYPYVYDSNSYVYAYVEGYLTNLKGYGLPSTSTGRLLSVEETLDTGIFPNKAARANGKEYFIGSASENTITELIGTDGSINGSCYDCQPLGVRPVIIVPAY